MATVIIKARQIDHMSTNGFGDLIIGCEMNERDMRAAFGEFLLHITEAQLASWLQDFSIEQAGAA